MEIIPPFLLELFQIYLEALDAWFSQRLYDLLIARLKDEFLVRLHARLDFGPLERACAAYHHAQGPGAKPAHPIPRLVRVLLLRYLFGWSYRTTEYHLRTNLLLKWFSGLALLAPVPDHTTVHDFEAWVRRNQGRLFFAEVLRQVDAAFPGERGRPQIADTFGMQAHAAQETLMGKLRHTCRILLRHWQQGHPEGYRRFEAALPAHPLVWQLLHPERGCPEKFLDETTRQQRLQAVVLGVLDFQELVRSLLAGCPGETLAATGLRLADLERVLGDEVRIERDPQGQVVRISELPGARKGSPLLGSATDREATFRVHAGGEDVQLGYNVGLLATPTGFLRQIEAYPGATPDQEVFPQLVAAQQQQGICPAELIADRAAGAGKTRARIAAISAGRTQVIAHLMPYEERSPRFTPEDFRLSPDGAVLTCPFGQATALAYRHGHADGRQFRFAASLCQGCPFNPHANPALMQVCQGSEPAQSGAKGSPVQPQAEAAGGAGHPKSKIRHPAPPDPAALRAALPAGVSPPASGKCVCRDAQSQPGSFRQVFISDYRQILAEAQVFNQSETFRQKIRLRPRIERLIAELTRYHGARRARGAGVAKADFQAKMCATAYNLKLWMRLAGRPKRSRPGAG